MASVAPRKIRQVLSSDSPAVQVQAHNQANCYKIRDHDNLAWDSIQMMVLRGEELLRCSNICLAGRQAEAELLRKASLAVKARLRPFRSTSQLVRNLHLVGSTAANPGNLWRHCVINESLNRPRPLLHPLSLHARLVLRTGRWGIEYYRGNANEKHIAREGDIIFTRGSQQLQFGNSDTFLIAHFYTVVGDVAPNALTMMPTRMLLPRAPAVQAVPPAPAPTAPAVYGSLPVIADPSASHPVIADPSASHPLDPAPVPATPRAATPVSRQRTPPKQPTRTYDQRDTRGTDVSTPSRRPPPSKRIMHEMPSDAAGAADELGGDADKGDDADPDVPGGEVAVGTVEPRQPPIKSLMQRLMELNPAAETRDLADDNIKVKRPDELDREHVPGTEGPRMENVDLGRPPQATRWKGKARESRDEAVQVKVEEDADGAVRVAADATDKRSRPSSNAVQSSLGTWNAGAPSRPSAPPSDAPGPSRARPSDTQATETHHAQADSGNTDDDYVGFPPPPASLDIRMSKTCLVYRIANR